jgi:hypothetical protein
MPSRREFSASAVMTSSTVARGMSGGKLHLEHREELRQQTTRLAMLRWRVVGTRRQWRHLVGTPDAFQHSRPPIKRCRSSEFGDCR